MNINIPTGDTWSWNTFIDDENLPCVDINLDISTPGRLFSVELNERSPTWEFLGFAIFTVDIDTLTIPRGGQWHLRSADASAEDPDIASGRWSEFE